MVDLEARDEDRLSRPSFFERQERPGEDWGLWPACGDG